MLFHPEEVLLLREWDGTKHSLSLQRSLHSLCCKERSLASHPSKLKKILNSQKPTRKNNPKATKSCLYYKSR